MSATMRMPFGKYKGLSLDEIPDQYLDWLASSVELREPLLGAVLAELRRREPATEPSRSQCPDPQLAESLVGAGYRVLAKKTHPDVGGRHEDFVRLGEVVAWLKREVGSA